MFKFDWRKSRFLGAGVAALVMLISLPSIGARKDNFGPTALPTIHVIEAARLNFGTVAIPASGMEYVEVSPTNQSTHGTGKMLFGGPSRGVYKLTSTGNDRAAITIDISNVSTGSSNFKLDHFQGIYSSILIRDFPSPTLPMPPHDQGIPLYLGARATVNSAMTPGSLNPTFDIAVVVN
jgi:hypothetical protein